MLSETRETYLEKELSRMVDRSEDTTDMASSSEEESESEENGLPARDLLCCQSS